MDNLLNNTFYQHPKCFARVLNNCSKKISGEHIISKSILKFLMPENTIHLSGPKWLDNQPEKIISINRYNAKILCKTHNAALSDLDTIMLKFVQFIYSIKEGQLEKIELNGYDIERWMLKALCGFIASNSPNNKFKDWTPPNKWLQILFSKHSFESGLGLYYLANDFQKEDRNNQFGIFPITINSQGIITGIGLLITAHYFLFLMEPITQQQINLYPGYTPIYHPGIIEMNFGTSQKTVDLGWNLENSVYLDILSIRKNNA